MRDRFRIDYADLISLFFTFLFLSSCYGLEFKIISTRNEWDLNKWNRAILFVSVDESEMISDILNIEADSRLQISPLPPRIDLKGPSSIAIPLAIKVAPQAFAGPAPITIRVGSQTATLALSIPSLPAFKLDFVQGEGTYGEGHPIELTARVRNYGNEPLALQLSTDHSDNIDFSSNQCLLNPGEEHLTKLFWKGLKVGRHSVLLTAKTSAQQEIAIATVQILPVGQTFDPWQRIPARVGIVGLTSGSDQYLYMEGLAEEQFVNGRFEAYGRAPIVGGSGISDALSTLGEAYQQFYADFDWKEWSGLVGDGVYSFSDLILNQQYGRGVSLAWEGPCKLEFLSLANAPNIDQGTFFILGGRASRSWTDSLRSDIAVAHFFKTSGPCTLFLDSGGPQTSLSGGIEWEPAVNQRVFAQLGRSLEPTGKAHEYYTDSAGPWAWNLGGSFEKNGVFGSAGWRAAQKGFLGTFNNSSWMGGTLSLPFLNASRIIGTISETKANLDGSDTGQVPSETLLGSISALSNLPRRMFGSISANYQSFSQGWPNHIHKAETWYGALNLNKSWERLSLSGLLNAGAQRANFEPWQGSYFCAGAYGAYRFSSGVQATGFIQRVIAPGQVIANTSFGGMLQVNRERLIGHLSLQNMQGCEHGWLLQGRGTYKLLSGASVDATFRYQQIFLKQPWIGALIRLNIPFGLPIRRKQERSIQGVVVRKESNRAIPVSGVLVRAGEIDCLTDSQGRYHIGPLPPGPLRLSVPQRPDGLEAIFDTSQPITTELGIPLKKEIVLMRSSEIELSCVNDLGELLADLEGELQNGERVISFSTSHLYPIRFKNLTSGTWKLQFKKGVGWELPIPQTIILQEGEKKLLRIQWKRFERNIQWQRNHTS